MLEDFIIFCGQKVKVNSHRWMPVKEEDPPTSCRYCWSKGRRHWDDPVVG